MLDISEGDSSDNDSGSIVCEAIRKAAKEVSLNLLPEKSKRIYTKAYNEFKNWQTKGTNSYCEDVLLVYFSEFLQRYKPNSLWSTYSMLKTTIKTYNQIDIKDYKQLFAFLEKQSKGYIPKKSPVFSKQDLSKFIDEAPDNKYLCDKVILIFGIAGASRREEFCNLIKKKDVTILDDKSTLLVRIGKTKNDVPRSFTITGELCDICLKYIQLRPKICSTDKFFLRFMSGKCTQQSIGINKFGNMPREIAVYLKLPNASDFTGHSFRRTSATLLVDAGADLTTLMRHGGWKSSTVATGYIANSLNNKKRIFEKISTDIVSKRQASDSNVEKNLHSAPRFINNNGSNTTLTISQIVIPPTSQEDEIVNFNQSYSLSDSEISNEFESEIHHSNLPVDSVNLKKSVAVQTDKNPFVEFEKMKKDVSVQVENECEPLSSQMLHFQFNKRNLPVYYDPDVGLYVSNLGDGNFNNTFIFKNCNVKIDGSYI